MKLDEDELIKTAGGARPEKRSVERQKEGSEADLTLAKRQIWTPDLQAQVIYQQAERNDNKDSWGGALGATLPLWNQNGGARKAATAKIDALDRQRTDVEQQISLEVHQAFLQLNLSREQIKLWNAAVDDATESARLAQQRYLEGEVDLSIFFQSRRDLVSAMLSYIDAVRDYHVNLAALERAVGVDLGKR